MVINRLMLIAHVQLWGIQSDIYGLFSMHGYDENIISEQSGMSTTGERQLEKHTKKR